MKCEHESGLAKRMRHRIILSSLPLCLVFGLDGGVRRAFRVGDGQEAFVGPTLWELSLNAAAHDLELETHCKFLDRHPVFGARAAISCQHELIGWSEINAGMKC
eukprot:1159208-Pelagomonas_calceolata.AAC.9